MATASRDQSHLIELGESELKVGKGDPIRLLNETTRKNPNSFRFVLGHILNFFFGAERKKAAKAMQDTSGRYASTHPNAKVKKMTADALSKLLNDDDNAEYWHLEAIARSIDLPTGALLLISRTYSLVRDGKKDAALALAAGVHNLADCLTQMAETKTISREYFETVANGFAKSTDLEGAPRLWDANT